MEVTAEEKLHGGRRPSEVTTPTEGGWGWMVVAGCFLATICIRAVTRCVSLFFVEFQLHFEKDYASTAWTHSLVDCTTMLCAPLGGYLASRFSCRVTVMLGGLLSSAGLVLSSFASSLEFLYISLGIVTGVGFALSYSPAVAMVGRYFSERKALAYGVAMSGNGIGTFVLAPAVQLLMELYGWRGALLVLAGLVSNLCVCGALMRPPPTVRPRILETSGSRSGGSRSGSLGPAGPGGLLPPPGVLASLQLQQPVQGHKLMEAPLGGGGGRAEELVEAGGSGPSGGPRWPPGPMAQYGFLVDADFLLLCVSFLLLAFGCGPPVVYLVPYARSAGLGARRAALLMSAFGVSGIAGNVTFGWIADRKCVRRFRLASYSAAIGAEGLCCAALHLLRSFPLLLPFALLYGYFDGAYVALIPVVTSDIVGSAHLASALGVVYFLHAIPYLISPPIGGWLVDWTGGYAATFSLSAAAFVLSSGVLVSASLVRSFQSTAAQQRLL